MGQSLVKNYMHIIFSTKHRKPLIDETIETELYNYLGGICNNLECQPLKIGGHKDHVHVHCLLSKKISLIDFMKKMKAGSSKWIKTKGDKYREFFWQDGYGAFSVNPTQTKSVIKYIEDQHIHHQNMTFQEEYRLFLKKYEVDYDERYVWD
jgi:REP element-mobilizing transposase RayT